MIAAPRAGGGAYAPSVADRGLWFIGHRCLGRGADGCAPAGARRLRRCRRQQNGFTLYRGAPLIVDAGVYSGDGLSYHDRNYYVRTVAHNTLLVDNPDESFEASRPGAESNDGGQRSVYPASRSPQSVEHWDVHADQYETGEITAFEHADAFTYVRGDATAAYNNPTYNQAMDAGGDYVDSVAKVSRFERELVYLREGTAGADELLLLYDRVGVTQAAFSGSATKLLFHTIGEPEVDGTGTVISPGETLYDGASSASASTDGHPVELRFLLPASRAVRKVGGRGVKSFWVRDTNYDWHWSDTEPQPRPTSDFEDEPFGEWRLELEPADTALEHAFLTAIAPSDQVPPLSVISGTGVEGVAIASSGEARVVLFSAAADGAPPAGPITYAAPGGIPTRHVLVDLTPGSTWSLTTSRDGDRATVELTADGDGALQASSAGVLQLLLDAPVTCDLDGSGSCGAGDAAEMARAISDPSYLPANSPDLDRDGDRDGADTVLLLAMCYNAP
jgi:heparin/heparan-sulfate lyase